jgi:hypothetical protein
MYTGSLLLRAERRSAAHQVAGVALRGLGLAGRDAFGADLPRQVLGRHLAVAVHQHDQRLAGLVLHHQGLHHGMLVDVQLARRHARAAVLLVFVEMVGVGDAVLQQEAGGGGFRGMGFVFHFSILQNPP